MNKRQTTCNTCKGKARKKNLLEDVPVSRAEGWNCRNNCRFWFHIFFEKHGQARVLGQIGRRHRLANREATDATLQRTAKEMSLQCWQGLCRTIRTSNYGICMSV